MKLTTFPAISNNFIPVDFRTNSESTLPLVTIGVLSYNYAAYVLNTLQSIYKQTYQHIEFFIVDDCSTDNSVALIEKWISDNNVSCTLIIHPVNRGRNIAINTILSKSKGKYVVLFASDDEMNLRRIEEQVKAMEAAGEQFSVCYSDAELMNEKGEDRGLYSQKMNSTFLTGNVFEQFYNGQFFMAAPTIMFRKSIYDKVGLYDDRLTAEDYDMWMRILPVSQVLFCKYVGVKYRIRENENLTDAHQFIHQQWYHKDRVIIYFKLIQLLNTLKKWPDIRDAATRKITFHLIHLKQLRSPYYSRMMMFLIKNSFYKISFRKLFKLQLSQMLPNYKTKVEHRKD